MVSVGRITGVEVAGTVVDVADGITAVGGTLVHVAGGGNVGEI